ncbi:ABC transporter ATP-binding protein [Oryzibacter oryziterrae]|uniref:ABC transporter ATP-binding protein n=1 Tax=Oryzibacter oryziterrae TaxID=2766474 RepID=UPI001F022864|nr:ATP-binding cassette domain-containing protein [Oryzibacter oryziterrae]
MSEPLELHIARKTYRGAEGGTVEAVRDLSLAFDSGRFTALIGPSGCGKTTSLRILAGLDHDFEGRVKLPADTRIGFVFQEPRLLPWRTVIDNIRLVLDAPDTADLTPLIDELGLSGMERKFPTELSLGLARRVALARALAIAPDLLILDEPFTSLDETTALRLRQMVLTAWKRRHTTAILVTHNIREALQLADRIILLAPSPARVVADLGIGLPQEERTEAFVEEMRTKMVRDWPGLVA